MEEDSKPVLPKPEPFKPEEKSTFLPTKPLAVSLPPKISPSSIPNPSPSVSTNKPPEPGFPNYGSYLYSIPGYSAFQPVSYPSTVQPHPGPVQTDQSKPEFVPYPPNTVKEPDAEERLVIDEDVKSNSSKQQDFEDHFTPEIIQAVPNTEIHSKTSTESKMNITSLTQGSGATVTIPHQVNKDIKKKTERFSLKTSIPISKIDMKCVTNSVDTLQNSTKKPAFNPTFQKESIEKAKVEIQSNIVIKTASKQAEAKEKPLNKQNNSISTLINAAEAISKNDNQFRVPEPKPDALAQPAEGKNAPSVNSQPPPAAVQRPMFNPLNLEKPNFPLKPPEGGYNEMKNQIVYVQNKNVTNPKMVVTLQTPQNPQVLLQRTNFDSKNLQAPSRLLNLKKTKEELVADNGTSSKVVALKRLHQDNGDENDFENLITENQIYGNKIVVKEKSQGTQQEQDLNVKSKEKQTQSETKNVVIQPSYVYVSNAQFPATMMMIKTNSKTCQTTDSYKPKVSPNENKTTEATAVSNNCDSFGTIKNNCKPQNLTNKDIHVLKSSNVLQSLSNNNNNKKPEILIATNQKVVVSPQVAYQVIADPDNKNQLNKEVPKVMTPKKDIPKLIEMKGTEKKIFIACQYKVDSKLHPKLVIANLKPKIATKVEVVSTLDIYARRKRLRRLKYLSNNNKDIPKVETRKGLEKAVTSTKNIITPDKMKAEIFKEFANTKDKLKTDNESDSDYGEEELLEYNSIIDEYGSSNEKNKVEFLSGLRLATHDAYRERDLEKQYRNLKHDSVATAYIAAGMLDKSTDEPPVLQSPAEVPLPTLVEEDSETLRCKQKFLSQLRLKRVTQQYKEAYEKSWLEVIKERRRRYGLTEPAAPSKTKLDTDTQLQLLTEIKNSVNINNNLIKKRLDPSDVDSSDIRKLAEKNFTELNRLSKMADRSVKLLSGQDARKRDLNPGFDSENIQKLNFKIEPYRDYPNLIIPSISMIVSLKSEQESIVAMSTQATSMDEPASCAAGVAGASGAGSHQVAPESTRDVECQAGGGAGASWPGVDAFVKTYREYEIARKKEIASLHRSNTSLCVECAHVTRAASRHSDRARALLAERRHLSIEETNLRMSMQRLCTAINVIRNS